MVQLMQPVGLSSLHLAPCSAVPFVFATLSLQWLKCPAPERRAGAAGGTVWGSRHQFQRVCQRAVAQERARACFWQVVRHAVGLSVGIAAARVLPSGLLLDWRQPDQASPAF